MSVFDNNIDTNYAKFSHRFKLRIACNPWIDGCLNFNLQGW
ncbi:hypothetical protein B6N60_01318 [Richelia sinica FACHB-800]|uniref:Uncharacterized protein n=1 Tax=Richelia sinica FACHB-800 TaxID=1357546 RepID=A0A975Y3Z0_9NOST|nr:hypothetical protein B6N60_01318 [Richelia sinica FACHB-800]